MKIIKAKTLLTQASVKALPTRIDENRELPKKIYRYTNFASLIDMLKNNQITLLDQSSWNDKNDIYSMLKAKELLEKAVLSMCFTTARETYHHWHIFSGGHDGVKVTFDVELLQKAISDHCLENKDDKDAFKLELMRYFTMEELAKVRLEPKQLPFVKRFSYEAEKEVRLVYFGNKTDGKPKRIPIGPKCITAIGLSPWVHPSLIPNLRAVFQSLREKGGPPGWQIRQSGLINSQLWQDAINSQLK